MSLATPVAVLFGGPSLEHDVSVASGVEVLEHLDRTRYRPIPVLIQRDGTWEVDGTPTAGPLEAGIALRANGCGVAFIALHGPFGEDGTVQGFLQTIGLKFTGSGVAGSALARDKIRAKRYLSTIGITGAPQEIVPPATAEDVRRNLGFPVMVKNPLQGSTLGLELARDAQEYEAAVARLSVDCDRLLIERQEVGREFTVPVLDRLDGTTETLPLVEIRAPSGVFDYEAKYTPGGCEEIVNPDVEESAADRMRDIARDAHVALGLSGFSRSDFILRPDKTPVFLETNSIPGLTPTSLLPQSAVAAGIDFPALLTRLIEIAVRCPH